MHREFSRRHLLLATGALGAATSWPGRVFAAEGPPAAEPVPASFPTQPPELAREMVGVSHGNLVRVRELLAARPTLARATWDWGFGDWESALGAASHTGQREIAELLIAHGARPDLFSAAMLGELETVRAFVAARPGCQRIPGPHGLSLLAHARAGGEAAAAVVAWLETVEGADDGPATEPLADADREAVHGRYRFGGGESDVLTVETGRRGLTIRREGATARGLLHRGGRAFSPVGAPEVRIRFAPLEGAAVEISVHDPDLVLTARREPPAAAG